MKTHTILAIGAHVGDAELTAGALLATCAVHGGRAVTLALTAGEKARLPGRMLPSIVRIKLRRQRPLQRSWGARAMSLTMWMDCCPIMMRCAFRCATLSAR